MISAQFRSCWGIAMILVMA